MRLSSFQDILSLHCCYFFKICTCIVYSEVGRLRLCGGYSNKISRSIQCLSTKKEVTGFLRASNIRGDPYIADFFHIPSHLRDAIVATLCEGLYTPHHPLPHGLPLCICRRVSCDPGWSATEPNSRPVLAKSVSHKLINKTYSDSVFHADHEFDLRNWKRVLQKRWN